MIEDGFSGFLFDDDKQAIGAIRDLLASRREDKLLNKRLRSEPRDTVGRRPLAICWSTTALPASRSRSDQRRS